MSKLIPPLCLILALLSVITAFALVMTGTPEVGIELHQARVGDDDKYRLLLEEQLEDQRRQRHYLIAALSTSGVLLTTVAFLSMRPAQGSLTP